MIIIRLVLENIMSRHCNARSPVDFGQFLTILGSFEKKFIFMSCHFSHFNYSATQGSFFFTFFFTFPSISRDRYVLWPWFFSWRKELRLENLLNTQNIVFRCVENFLEAFEVKLLPKNSSVCQKFRRSDKAWFCFFPAPRKFLFTLTCHATFRLHTNPTHHLSHPSSQLPQRGCFRWTRVHFLTMHPSRLWVLAFLKSDSEKCSLNVHIFRREWRIVFLKGPEYWE